MKSSTAPSAAARRAAPGLLQVRMPSDTCRHLVLVLGDQLAPDQPALAGFDPALDVVLMIESKDEANHVWSHKARLVLFLSAMRHYGDALKERGFPVHYVKLGEPKGPKGGSLGTVLAAQLERLRPERLIVCEPGEWRVLSALQDVCEAARVPMEVRVDTHFMVSQGEFRHWAAGRKSLLMEHFYRHLRKRTGILMQGDEPEGGVWNFDKENRRGFPASGPGAIPPPVQFAPDAITREVMLEVQNHFPDHPGELDAFPWPVTREQALTAMQGFIKFRLPGFGRFQDAMWSDTPFGWHALLAPCLNLKLLSPREVIDAVLEAYRARSLPLAAVEGFIRQIMGWREFMRGVYWLDMPGLADANHYRHQRALPRWYWTGRTRMNCMRQTVGQTLKHGYAHHIQRLMVTGNFALLAEVDPRQVSDWYLAAYVDAVEWVQLPNTVGMALFAAGPRFTTKPYVASGAYIKRMSNYCASCEYRPELRHGAQACPMTVLYWHFLDTHESAFSGNPRTALMVKTLSRLSDEERRAVRKDAKRLLEALDEE